MKGKFVRLVEDTNSGWNARYPAKLEELGFTFVNNKDGYWEQKPNNWTEIIIDDEELRDNEYEGGEIKLTDVYFKSVGGEIYDDLNTIEARLEINSWKKLKNLVDDPENTFIELNDEDNPSHISPNKNQKVKWITPDEESSYWHWNN